MRCGCSCRHPGADSSNWIPYRLGRCHTWQSADGNPSGEDPNCSCRSPALSLVVPSMYTSDQSSQCCPGQTKEGTVFVHARSRHAMSPPSEGLWRHPSSRTNLYYGVIDLFILRAVNEFYLSWPKVDVRKENRLVVCSDEELNFGSGVFRAFRIVIICADFMPGSETVVWNKHILFCGIRVYDTVFPRCNQE